MKIIACGGRDYTDGKRVDDELSRIHAETPITELIEGGARGADELAAKWAVLNGVKHTKVRAEWGRYGKAAGPMRNQKMLNEGKPDLVVAFPSPDSTGTWDMVNRAKRAGVKVVVIEDK